MIAARCCSVVLVSGLALAACGATAGAPSTSGSSSPTLSPKPPTEPPNAQVTSTGSGGLGGSLTVASVICQEPSLDGSTIVVNGSFPSAAGVAVRVTIGASQVTLEADAGSGSSFEAREFTGSGVTAFDPATGATVNTTLTAAAGSAAVAGIGVAASVSARVRCNNQQPGTSTLRLKGSTLDGSVNDQIRAAHVTCESGGVLILGVITAGTTDALIDMFGSDRTYSFFLVTQGSLVDQSFASQGPVTVTVTSHGAHFDAVANQSASDGGPNTIHTSGSVTCGSSTTA